MNNLQGERERWQQDLARIMRQLSSLHYDCLPLAGLLTYLGLFSLSLSLSLSLARSLSCYGLLGLFRVIISFDYQFY